MIDGTPRDPNHELHGARELPEEVPERPNLWAISSRLRAWQMSIRTSIAEDLVPIG